MIHHLFIQKDSTTGKVTIALPDGSHTPEQYRQEEESCWSLIWLFNE